MKKERERIQETKQKKVKKKEQKKKKTKRDIPSWAAELPKPIQIVVDHQPFDVLQFLRTTMVEGLYIAQLLHVSPTLRQQVARSLHTLKNTDQAMWIQQFPSIGDLLDKPIEIEALWTQADVSKSSTHTVNAV
ncbi:hypothetical protein BGZ49_005607, partial [Haplosporangium sp. Z 27]